MSSSSLLDTSRISPCLTDLNEYCCQNISRKFGKSGHFSIQIKNEHANEIIKKVKRLSLTLKIHNINSPSLLDKRVQSLGEKMLQALDETTNASNFEERILRISICLLNLKNALQVEGSIFGLTHTILNRRITTFKEALYSDPEKTEKVREILEIIPNFDKKINLINNSTLIEIDISDLLSNFDEKNIGNLSQQFDVEMFKLTAFYGFKNGKLYIPTLLFPNQNYIDKLLKSPDDNVRLLAQFLYISRLYSKEITETGFIFTEAQEVLSTLLTTPEDDIENIQFIEYLKHEKVVPCLALLIYKLKEYLEKKQPFQNILYSAQELFEIADYVGESWRDESIEFYDLILEIDKTLSTCYGKEFKGLIEKIHHDGSDVRLVQMFKVADIQNKRMKTDWKNPLSSASKFCKSKQEFAQLLRGFKVFEFIEAHKHPLYNEKKIEDESTTEGLKATSKPSAKKPSKTTLSKHTAKETSAAPIMQKKNLLPTSDGMKNEELDIGLETDSDDLTQVSESDTASSYNETSCTPNLSNIQKEIFSSFESQKQALNIKVHPRVSSWFSSAESGLISHGWNSTHILEREEMILRHRFPYCILNFIQNDHYSKKSFSLQSDNSVKRESLLLIDGKKYILEAVFNSSNVLFHLYARPLKTTKDYFCANDFSSSYFPTLKESLNPQTTLFEIDQSSLNVKADGNLTLHFEGHFYEIIFLGQNL